jgi:hypothetical protein
MFLSTEKMEIQAPFLREKGLVEKPLNLFFDQIVFGTIKEIDWMNLTLSFHGVGFLLPS